MNTVEDSNAFVLLKVEWEQLCAAPGLAEAVRGWLVEDGLWQRWEGPYDLDAVLRELQAGRRCESDQWLSALLTRVVNGESSWLAARVLVQAMAPSALKTVRRLARQGGESRDEVAQVVLASLYEVVRCYPLAQRPGKIAANISLDTFKVALRELRREREIGAVELEEAACAAGGGEADPTLHAERMYVARDAAAVGLGMDGAEDLAGARGELVELLLWALRERVLGREGVGALFEHYREGARADVVAARDAGVSPGAWRQRRSRAVRQLRAAVPMWLAQAA